MAPLLAILDTNILIHFRQFDEVDWLNELGFDEVQLVIVPAVYRELDEKKSQSRSSKIRKRVRAVLSKLHDRLADASSATISEHVSLRLDHVDPSIDFASHSLNPSINDDHIIASGIVMAGRGKTVTVVCADYLLRQKARASGLAAHVLDERYRLADEPSDEDKIIRQLRQDLKRSTLRRPELELLLGSGEKVLKTQLQPLQDLTDAEIQRLLQDVIQRYPKQSDPTGFGHSMVETYNMKLALFYKEYEQYIQRRHAHRQAKAMTVKVTFELTNSGDKPATDIGVSIRTAEPVVARESLDSLATRPKAPKPPQLQPFSPFSGISSLALMPPHLPPISRAGEPSFDLEPCEQGFEISAHVRSLKHGYTTELGSVFVDYSNERSVIPFGMSYSLDCAELPGRVTGNVHVAPSLSNPTEGVGPEDTEAAPE